jgi:hypothetical protein
MFNRKGNRVVIYSCGAADVANSVYFYCHAKVFAVIFFTQER